MKNLLKIFLWIPASLATILFSLHSFQKISLTKNVSGLIRQEVNYTFSQKPSSFTFAAIPKAAFEIKTAIATQDARPIVINKYLEYWDSPMQGLGDYIVHAADKNQIDPYLVVAIAQQESNLGKKTPDSCYNAWGWGIHSEGTLCFNSWKEGISAFSQGLSENYYAYGLKTPEEIMTKYVPHSPGGAWAKGVNQFLADLQIGQL